MQLKRFAWAVLLVILHITSTTQRRQSPLSSDYDYFYLDPEVDDNSLNYNDYIQERPGKYTFNAIPRSAIFGLNEASFSAETTTECETEQPGGEPTTVSPPLLTGTQAPAATPPAASAGGAAPSGSSSSSSSTSTNTTTTTSNSSTGESAAGVTGAPPASAASAATTTTVAPSASAETATQPHSAAPSSDSGGISTTDQDAKARELRTLVQHLYVAQARVQLEAIEIKKAQAVANAAQSQLEEAANHVRAVTAALQTAQQEVASAAIRAQTAQLQLAAHDQLLFAARQDVDALSSQMVGLQAAEGIAAPTVRFDVAGLLEKLRQPLAESEKPTAVPPVVPMPSMSKGHEAPVQDFYYD